MTYLPPHTPNDRLHILHDDLTLSVCGHTIPAGTEVRQIKEGDLTIVVCPVTDCGCASDLNDSVRRGLRGA